MKHETVRMCLGAFVIGAGVCGAMGQGTPCIDPLLLSELDLGENSLAVEVVGDTAYMGQLAAGGMQIVDVSDSANPVMLGSYSNPFESVFQLAVDGGVAYLASSGNLGLIAVDVGDPLNPFEIGSVPFQNCFSVKVVGTRAFLITIDGLVVVDISDPANMSVIGSVDFGGGQDVFVVGDVAYVPRASFGFDIYDVDPVLTNPFFLGSIDFGGVAIRVFVDGTTAYVTQIAGPSDELVAIDVSDPTTPFVLGTFDTPGNAWNVDVVGGTTAYIADQFSGLSIVDVTDPTMMSLIGNYDTAGQGFDVVVDGSTAYLAEIPAGLVILDVGNGCLCPGDLSNDGMLDFLDISLFLTAFGAGDLVADFNNDGSVDFLDISLFVSFFGAGCP